MMMPHEVNLFLFVTNLIIAVLIGALLPIMPILTRKSYLFGVKIPIEKQNSPEAKSMKKSYILICLIGSAVIFALVIAQFVIMPELTLLAVMYFPFLFIILQTAAFIPNWRKAVKLKETNGWKVLESTFAETKSSHSRGNLSDLPWVWYIVGLILIFVSVVIALVQYPSLPDKIPTHFDINMQPDAWSDKSILTVMMIPLINLVMTLILWLTNVMFVRAKLQIDPQNPSLSFAQHRAYRRRMGHSMGFLALGLVIIFVLTGFMSIIPDFKIPFWLMIGIILVVTVPLCVVSIHSGQGGCRIKPKMIAENASVKQRSPSNIDNAIASGRGDDRYWILGMFYFNRDDPAYIVENRFGNNLGFNYSKLPVQIGTALLVLALVAMYAWITVLLC